MGISVGFEPLPQWLRVRAPSGEGHARIKTLLAEHGLNTVCQEALCPNISECWAGGTATFMIMGAACTRGCRFCSVESAAKPGPLDPNEPQHLAESLAALNLKYAVITQVARDDLSDQGASHVADCIRQVKARNPVLIVEMLIADFRGDENCLRAVVDSGVDVLSHNLETVRRLTPWVRDRRSSYEQSLAVLRRAKEMRPGLVTKSSLMAGLGETEEEFLESFRDLREIGVEVLTVGQYLRPTREGRHLTVAQYVPPSKFEEMENWAKDLGFLYVACGPFVRSSYRAGELFIEGRINALKLSKC
ncbi:MAG: lipoyl synthase [Elusimicrobia bacterium]|nr:lipoyl synthase [Elusimicrobiota bacterium]